MDMTAPRQVLAGETYFITRRCTQRQYLLRPDPVTTQIFLYCLAVAAQRCAIEVVVWMAMSNHYHAVVHDPRARLPAFLEHFHKLMAKTMNARWGRWENFWSTEQTCVVRLVTPQDVFEKVLYVLANPIADHLVDRVVDWPGASALPHVGRRPLVVKRPAVFFRRNGAMPATVSLQAVAPRGVEGGAWALRVQEAVTCRERAARDERHQRAARVLGRKALRRLSPFGRPLTRAPRRNLRPVIACRDPGRRTLELAALRAFRERYARAREQLGGGALDVRFPAGTYRWRLLGASCDPDLPRLRAESPTL